MGESVGGANGLTTCSPTTHCHSELARNLKSLRNPDRHTCEHPSIGEVGLLARRAEHADPAGYANLPTGWLRATSGEAKHPCVMRIRVSGSEATRSGSVTITANAPIVSANTDRFLLRRNDKDRRMVTGALSVCGGCGNAQSSGVALPYQGVVCADPSWRRGGPSATMKDTWPVRDWSRKCPPGYGTSRKAIIATMLAHATHVSRQDGRSKLAPMDTQPYRK